MVSHSLPAGLRRSGARCALPSEAGVKVQASAAMRNRRMKTSRRRPTPCPRAVAQLVVLVLFLARRRCHTLCRLETSREDAGGMFRAQDGTLLLQWTAANVGREKSPYGA